MTPQSRAGRLTFNGVMRDFNRRMLAQERRTQYALNSNGAMLATVQTVAEVTDAATWYYVIDDNLVHHAGTTMTYAAWQAGLP